jgi:hypothetical protein
MRGAAEIIGCGIGSTVWIGWWDCPSKEEKVGEEGQIVHIHNTIVVDVSSIVAGYGRPCEEEEGKDGKVVYVDHEIVVYIASDELLDRGPKPSTGDTI